MLISGFSFARNADKLYYPLAQAVASALPLVDEFVVALGAGDPDDTTRSKLLALNSPKLRIIDTVWDLEAYPRGMENAHQTDIARSHCRGEWLLYLQADEVLHEDDLPVIRSRCEALRDRPDIEGLLFGYHHFWGSYDHELRSHGWYREEIRIIRNRPDIHSWQSAQSFRRIPGFDGMNYRQEAGTYKLRVARVAAHIYHYGWVRPPRLMQQKRQALDTIHHGAAAVAAAYAGQQDLFDYGDMRLIPAFKGTHPAVMRDWMARMDWQDQLRYGGGPPRTRPLAKHELPKYRLVSWLENHLFGGRTLWGFRNYILSPA
ncbi:MAG: hypothetical protein SF053_11190 [Bacteroidia bacterium]|nr:hypothetical protein [Bacteroidia bacterium]